MCIKLGVLLRAHHRHEQLDIALQELLRYNELPGLEVKIQVLVDRPHFLVEGVLKKYRDRLYGLAYCPFPIVSARGYRFMESNNYNLKRLEHCDPDWVYVADDDAWFAPPMIDKELPEALTSTTVDLWYAKSLFLWDDPRQYNENRKHYGPVIWRHQPGARWPLDRSLQVPMPLHDEAIMTRRVGDLTTPLLDYGSYDEPERVRLYNAYLRAGRDPHDAWVSSLVEPPDLRSLDLSEDWIDLWSARHEIPE